MKNRLVKKLKGFQRAPRARLLLLTQKRLSQEEFVLYELGIALTVWDRKKEDYGTFQATNQELANLLGWSSDTSALRHKKTLIEKGFFKEVEEQRIKPIAFEKWQSKNPQVANKQKADAETQSLSANIEESSAKTEDYQPQFSNSSLVSSKVNLGSFVADPNEYFSDEDIAEISRVLEERDSS